MTAQQFLDDLMAKHGLSPEHRKQLDTDLGTLLDNARSEGYSEGQDDAYANEDDYYNHDKDCD